MTDLVNDAIEAAAQACGPIKARGDIGPRNRIRLAIKAYLSHPQTIAQMQAELIDRMELSDDIALIQANALLAAIMPRLTP